MIPTGGRSWSSSVRAVGRSSSWPTRCRSAGRPCRRHLRLLKDAGLVIEEPRGTRRIYRLHDEGVAAVRGYLEQVWGEAAARFRLVAENATPRERAESTEP